MTGTPGKESPVEDPAWTSSPIRFTFGSLSLSEVSQAKTLLRYKDPSAYSIKEGAWGPPHPETTQKVRPRIW